MNPPPSSVLVNGKPDVAIDPTDRGFALGDGLFETVAVRHGRPRLWQSHCERLAGGCGRLGLTVPDLVRLRSEVDAVIGGTDAGTVRITVTRGPGPRGYAPPPDPHPTRVVAFQPAVSPGPPRADGLRLRWCATRLALQPALAGLKHLNRLEQILARSEWSDPDIDEGVMRATDGRVIECTAANLFLVQSGTLITPALDECGVAGVMRAAVIRAAEAQAIAVAVRDVQPAEVAAADALFVTSATRGLSPVARLDERTFPADDPVVHRLTEHLEHEFGNNRE